MKKNQLGHLQSNFIFQFNDIQYGAFSFCLGNFLSIANFFPFLTKINNATRSIYLEVQNGLFFSVHLEGPQKMATYCLGSILNCHILAIIDILFLPTTTQKMAPTTLLSISLSFHQMFSNKED